MHYIRISFVDVQVCIFPAESQLLASQSICQETQAHRISHSEGNTQRFWEQMILPFNQLSVSPQTKILSSSLWA